MGKGVWGIEAAGALKRFGESLMRRAESDPRLARAIEQGYDLSTPRLHGTKSVLPTDETLRPLFMAPEPEHALNYTGGGRRGGPGELKESKAAKPRVPRVGPNTVPLVLKGKPNELNMPYYEWLPYSDKDTSWLKEFGVNDPEQFRLDALAHNKQPSERIGFAPGYGPDDIWGMFAKKLEGRDQYDHIGKVQLYDLLDSPGFLKALQARDIKSLEFKHPYTVNDYKQKRFNEVGRSDDGKAVLAVDPAIVRSPFANFEEEGVGLMKAKGGLVRMKEHSCG